MRGRLYCGRFLRPEYKLPTAGRFAGNTVGAGLPFGEELREREPVDADPAGELHGTSRPLPAEECFRGEQALVAGLLASDGGRGLRDDTEPHGRRQFAQGFLREADGGTGLFPEPEHRCRRPRLRGSRRQAAGWPPSARAIRPPPGPASPPAAAAPPRGSGTSRTTDRRCSDRARGRGPPPRRSPGCPRAAVPGTAAAGGPGQAASPPGSAFRSRGRAPAGPVRPGRQGCGRAGLPRRRYRRRRLPGRRGGRPGPQPPGPSPVDATSTVLICTGESPSSRNADRGGGGDVGGAGLQLVVHHDGADGDRVAVHVPAAGEVGRDGGEGQRVGPAAAGDQDPFRVARSGQRVLQHFPRGADDGREPAGPASSAGLPLERLSAGNGTGSHGN